jgi:Siphovirus Gp157
MSKMSLYDVSLEGLQIFDLLEESQGELTPELEARLDTLLLDGPVAIERAAMVVKTLEQNAVSCEAEVDRLRERAKSFSDQASKLKLRMTLCLDNAFNGKVKTPLFTVWTQKSADRTVAELIPGVTPEMLHEERPDLVRVKMELDREKIVGLYKNPETRKSLPELLLFEEKEGSRYVRIK